MQCPYCGRDNDKVIDSRSSDGSLAIRRRRECLACSKRYTTYERVERTARLAVVKRDGRRMPFDGQKVLASIQAACGKRPLSEELKVRIASEIEDAVHRDFEREVPSTEIGRRVAAALREADPIAYIRYASEYYEFSSLDDVIHEARKVLERPRNLPNQTPLFNEAP